MKKEIRWVKGNKLTLSIPLQKVTFTIGGKAVENYDPPTGSEIVVELLGQSGVYRYVPEVADGNVLVFTDNGQLGAGTYAIIIEVIEPDGTMRRSQWNNMLTVFSETSAVLESGYPKLAEGMVNGSVLAW